ncbi:MULTISPECIES: hypothetical protein [Sorangium]|uniref:hypothetical protein n=1 Tax=Sorangium TaxID=39643 RepID=UPI003D9C2DC2
MTNWIRILHYACQPEMLALGRQLLERELMMSNTPRRLSGDGGELRSANGRAR